MDSAKPAVQQSILIVDDEQDVLSVVSRYLGQQGLSVKTFADPVKAFEHFKQNPDFALIILDVKMPGMTGFELVTRVRGINPKVKVLIMTAFEISGKDFKEGLQGVVIDGFIRKPFSLKEFAGRILDLLNERKSKEYTLPSFGVL